MTLAVPRSDASIHSRRASRQACGVHPGADGVGGRWESVTDRGRVLFACAGDEWRTTHFATLRACEVEISFASCAVVACATAADWTARASLEGKSRLAAPAVIAPRKARVAVATWPKFERKPSPFLRSVINNCQSDHHHPLPTQHQDLGHVATQPTLANSVSTNRAASTSNHPKHRSQADQQAFLGHPPTDLSSSCPSKLPPPRWQTPPSTSRPLPPRAPPSAPAATSRSTRPRTRP